jgi:hypothetical protein
MEICKVKSIWFFAATMLLPFEIEPPIVQGRKRP